MKYCVNVAMVTFFLLITGCGGGGGSQSGDGSFTVGANEGANKTFGAITVKVDTGTFPNGSTLTLTQSVTAPAMPPTTNFKLAEPALRLTSTSTPQRDITISIADDGKDYIGAIADIDNEWLPLRQTRASGKINFTLPTALGRSDGRGIGKMWEWVIGLVKDNLPDTEYAIKRLEGSTEFAAPGTILCFHGFLDNYQSMATIGSQARIRLGGSNVFSYAFPYKQGAKEAGTRLATLLAPYKNQLKNITFVGYSQGVLVARQALEQLGATASVRDLILIFGPNEGSHLADVADFSFNLAKFWLSGTFSCSPFGVTVDDPAIKELRPGSQFLTDLNTFRKTQRGNVNYWAFNGDKDWVVSQDSAWASNTQLEELTGGSVWKHTVTGASHFNIKTDVALIMQMFGSMGLEFGNELSILIDPTPNVDASFDGWYFSWQIRNNTISWINLDYMALETYARDGLSYALQWYDPSTPSGIFFPTDCARWGISLAPGQTSDTVNIHLATDWERHSMDEAPPNLQAKTAVFILTGTQNGYPVKAKAELICHYGIDIWPAPAQTRSKALRDDKIGTFSPVSPPR